MTCTKTTTELRPTAQPRPTAQVCAAQAGPKNAVGRAGQALLRRAKSRRRQRGVSVFIVMMAIMVLSGAGLWAIYLSGLTAAGSGYQRAAAQALYAAELGTLAGSSYLSIPGVLEANYQANLKKADPCKSVSTGELCIALSMEEIDQRIATETATDTGGPFSLLDLSGGSLSAKNDVDGTFVVEISELRTVDVEGTANAGQQGASGLVYKTATVTTYGTVRPAAAGDLCAGVNENASSTRMATRARMILGPLPD